MVSDQKEYGFVPKDSSLDKPGNRFMGDMGSARLLNFYGTGCLESGAQMNLERNFDLPGLFLPS